LFIVMHQRQILLACIYIVHGQCTTLSFKSTAVKSVYYYIMCRHSIPKLYILYTAYIMIIIIMILWYYIKSSFYCPSRCTKIYSARTLYCSLSVLLIVRMVKKNIIKSSLFAWNSMKTTVVIIIWNMSETVQLSYK